MKKLSKASQKPFAIITLESREASFEAVLFNREYETVLKNSPELLEDGALALAEGEVSRDDDGENATLKLRLNRLIPLERAPELFTAKISLCVQESEATPEKLQQMMQLCGRHRGPAEFHLGIRLRSGSCLFFRPSFGLKPVSTLLSRLRQLFGEDAVTLKGSRNRPQPPRRGSFLRENGVSSED